jgi:hypothetical protein
MSEPTTEDWGSLPSEEEMDEFAMWLTGETEPEKAYSKMQTRNADDPS